MSVTWFYARLDTPMRGSLMSRAVPWTRSGSAGRAAVGPGRNRLLFWAARNGHSWDAAAPPGR